MFHFNVSFSYHWLMICQAHHPCKKSYLGQDTSSEVARQVAVDIFVDVKIVLKDSLLLHPFLSV